MSTSADLQQPIAERARSFAPVVWLLGKVQSGKTSIIRELTQASDAEIGSGFRACTKTARVFDFPAQAPIIRFLDTRGLGEVNYDPAADISFCEERSHLILAVMKALDLEQSAVLAIVRAVRQRHPEWPIVVAQTTLHEAYPVGAHHVLPYPFQAKDASAVPPNLLRALDYQRSLFRGLLGRGEPHFVPIDFTRPEDGLEPHAYGREALLETLIAAAPTAVAVALAELPGSSAERSAEQFNAHILGFALAAGASDAVPVAGVVAVPMVQAAMLRQLAKLHGVHWDKRAYAEFATALGAGTLVRTASSFGVRQLIKLIPVYGQTAGAAAAAVASFAATYAMGKAANYFLTRRRQGAEAEAVTAVYRNALSEAFQLAKARAIGTSARGAKP
ncbi:MAG TPA: GTPase domain-containing protein [Hyphomicrobiaceae bacterium]|nr:GTPase domain-containing protein [Hyphomicrobiaceae bacterium]